jgi:hypothetical protein
MSVFTSYEAEIAPLGNHVYQVIGGPQQSGPLHEPALLDMLKDYALSNRKGEPMSGEDVIRALSKSNTTVWVSMVRRTG